MQNDNGNDCYAAVDLGSNSFHLIVARTQGNDLQVLDRLRDSVRLAAGLDQDRNIQPEAMQRGLACLARFGERLASIPTDRVRVVGTNTLRRARNADAFIAEAEKVLGHPIEIIAGAEEARLIYGGVAPGIDPAFARRLVVDIGGGSTELIAGFGDAPRLLESLPLGCVSLTHRHFGDGKISRARWKAAVLDAEVALEPLVRDYRNFGWDVAAGASGTIREVQRIVELNGWSLPGISFKAMGKLRKALLKAKHIDTLLLEGLSDDRRPVIVAGVAILWALFESLRIETLAVSDRALRDGLLNDLIGRLHERDIRSNAVATLASRYEVDLKQAQRVEATALQLLEQVAGNWGLDRRRARMYLRWAATLHEIGLAITHSKHNRHGAYLMRYSDVAGFSQTDQRILSALIYLQRGKIRRENLGDVPPRLLEFTLRLAALLRLSVLLQRSRTDEAIPPEFSLKAENQRLRLELPAGWISEHPLTYTDLKAEKTRLAAAGIKFGFGTAEAAP